MQDLIAANRRIITLQVLSQQSAYELSNILLQRALERFGHAMSLSAVDDLIDWLADRDLIAARKLDGSIRVATLTQSGLDVAKGRMVADGVDRPLPMETADGPA